MRLREETVREREKERERERYGGGRKDEGEKRGAITSSEWRRPRGSVVISGNSNFQAN